MRSPDALSRFNLHIPSADHPPKRRPHTINTLTCPALPLLDSIPNHTPSLGLAHTTFARTPISNPTKKVRHSSIRKPFLLKLNQSAILQTAHSNTEKTPPKNPYKKMPNPAAAPLRPRSRSPLRCRILLQQQQEEEQRFFPCFF